jgi:predicted SprT family Zn-dependent metalloprotease
MAITTTPVLAGLSPGTQAHHEVQLAYDFFNKELFDGKLPPCFVSFQRKGSRVFGYFSPDRLGSAAGKRADEIALNPRHFKNRTPVEVMSTLVHEMVHQWQHHFGRQRSRRAYHNKEWAGEMLRLGLHPSHTGEPGGRMTGQQMTHYVMTGGRFEIAATKLQSMVPALTWFDLHAAELLPKGITETDLVAEQPMRRSGRRTVYRCPRCRKRAESDSTFFAICGHCEVPFERAGLR